jgi:nucleoside-diphosphate-sugar epimerase
MSTLLCFGLGYSAEHFIAAYGDGFERIIGTVRSAERAGVLNAHLSGRSKALVFDGAFARPEVNDAIRDAAFVLISIPPNEIGDPALTVFADALAQARQLRSIVYLSTVGVYGDHSGEWIDEETPAKPGSVRSRARLAAECAWQDFGSRHGTTVTILRLAGIYGPGQNALVRIEHGKARRVVKSGQVFNHIHVDDIAQAIDAAFARSASGIFNVADDEPSPAGEPLSFAAQLMGTVPPPEISYEEAAASMSPMARSFWQECRRARNDKLKRELGVNLRFPTYREGLRALFDSRSRDVASD